MLRPASRPAHHSPWLLPVTFIIAIEETPSHATTTGIGIGVDLKVISHWLSLIAIEENLLLYHYHWNLEVVFLGDLRALARGPQWADDVCCNNEETKM